MRAVEFITEVVNKELWHPERMFKQRVPIGAYEFEAREAIGGMGDYDADALTIIAYDPKKKNKVIGNVNFVVKGRGSKRSLVSDDTYVDPKYRGEGIATMMYAYAKSLGNDIKGSNIQTPMGKKMWANWGSDAEHLRGVTESYIYELAQEEVAPIGINVKTDKKSKRSYADLIVDGKKKYESRKGKSLMPFVGKTVSIIRTGDGPAKAIGSATVGRPIIVNEKQFRHLEPAHLVPQGSAFDIERGSYKYLYPMLNPHRYYKEYDVSNEGSIFVSRKVIK